MVLEIPEKCPKCSKQKFKVWDSENKEFVVDLDKGVAVPAGTLIRKIKCYYCEDFEQNNYQEPGGKKF